MPRSFSEYQLPRTHDETMPRMQPVRALRIRRFVVGALITLGMAVFFGHLSENDDTVIPVARPKCDAPKEFESLFSYDADGGRVHCVYVRKVAGVRPTVRRELAQ